MERTNTDLTGQIAEKVVEAIDGGQAVSTMRLPQEFIEGMLHDARKAHVRMVARPVGDWHRTSRATFIPDKQTKGMGVFDPKRWLTESRFVPGFSETRDVFESGVRAAGDVVDSDPLSQWTVNREGINYMHGRRHHPAEIPPHVDVSDQRGLVAAVEIQPAVGAVCIGDNVKFLLCDDVCKENGIVQHEHGVIASSYRIGVTFADMRPY